MEGARPRARGRAAELALQAAEQRRELIASLANGEPFKVAEGRPLVVPRKELRKKKYRRENAAYKLDHWRPSTRGECRDLPRPCPYVGCRHHLYLNPTHIGSLHFYRPREDVTELEHSCVLDVVEQFGELSLEQVGRLMNVTRERIRQIEERALRKLERKMPRENWHEPIGNPEYYGRLVNF